MSANPSNPKAEATIDLSRIFSAFRDRAWVIVITTTLTVAAALVWLRETPPVYVSEGILQVNGTDEPGAADLARESKKPAKTIEPEDLKTIEQTLASRAILLSVIEANGLANDPLFAPPREEGPYTESELARLLGAKIAVRLVRGTRLIAVSVQDHDPVKAQRLAQSVVDRFIEQRRDDRQSGSESAREFLTAEASRLGAELTGSEQRLGEYREVHDAVSLQEQQNIVVERLRELNLQASQAKNRRLEIEPDALTAQQAVGVDQLDQLLRLPKVAEAAEVTELRSELSQREAELADIVVSYGPAHPKRIRAANRLDDFKSSLRRALRAAGERIEQDYVSALGQEAALERALKAQEKAALNLDRVAIPYRALDREVQASRILYEKILDRLKELDVAREMMSVGKLAGDEIRLLDPPTVPARPARPSPRKVLAAALLGGILLGCGIILGWHALDDSVASVDEAESLLGIPVLTTIPRAKLRAGRAVPVITSAPASAEAEAFRSLRTSLALLDGTGDQRSALFTSAAPGEGKTLCSINYAASLAQQGFRTLLIDGDLHRPELSRLMTGGHRRMTLANCLAHPDLWPRAVMQTSIENLSLLGNSGSISEAAGLLARGGITEIIECTRDHFDRVVIDAPPLTTVSDALHLAQQSAMVCMVIRAHKTPRRTILRACQLLAIVAHRAPTGIILNQVRRGKYTSYYHHGSAGLLPAPATLQEAPNAT